MQYYNKYQRAHARTHARNRQQADVLTVLVRIMFRQTRHTRSKQVVPGICYTVAPPNYAIIVTVVNSLIIPRTASAIYIYNSVLKCQHTILKSGARTPRTVTKFAVKTDIDLTSTIYGWNFNFRSISIVFCPFCEHICLTGG